MTRYSISLNTTSEKTLSKKPLFLGYHNPLGPYMNCCEIWCREQGCVRNFTSSLPFQPFIWWNNGKHRQSPQEGTKDPDMGQGSSPQAGHGHQPSPQRDSSSFQELNSNFEHKKTYQCDIPHFRCLVSATQEAELTLICLGSHTNHISWGLGTAPTCQFDQSVLLLSQPAGFAKS